MRNLWIEHEVDNKLDSKAHGADERATIRIRYKKDGKSLIAGEIYVEYNNGKIEVCYNRKRVEPDED